MRFASSLIAVLLSGLATGCATVEERWSEARRCGSVECLEAFLSRSPDSEYAKEATRRLTLAREERKRNAAAEQAWSQAGKSAHSTGRIEVRTWTVADSCSLCASVEKSETITMTTETPTIDRVRSLIEQLLSKHTNPEFRIEVDRNTSNKLRLRAYGLKREILSGFDYWEYIYFDVGLAKVEDSTYDVSLTLAGNFKAGGQPATTTGYGDMLTSGYAAEMSNYASRLVTTIKRSIEGTQHRSSKGWP